MTYPDAAVTEELAAHWLEAHIDVVAAPDLPRQLGVHAIPSAVALRGDGVVLGRIEGFVPPAAFLERVAALR